MSAMRAKLKDQRGASITYALLIFLICAVASSIIIVASSAVAGRMANVPRSDRRYYAVTSAAGLLKDQIDGKTLVVTKKGEGKDAVYTVKYEGAVANTDRKEDVLADATVWLVKGEVAPLMYTLETNNHGDALNCDIVQTLENGLLTYTISNAIPEGDPRKEVYKLEIVFGSNMKESARNTTVKWKFHGMRKIVSTPKPTSTAGT